MTKYRAVLTVTIDAEGDYYADHDDLIANVVPWIEGALDDRDDIRNVTITETAPPAVSSPAPADRTALRDRIAEALTAAAYDCDGKCGLGEQECYDAHPITFSAMCGGTTHVDASVTAIADAVLAALHTPGCICGHPEQQHFEDVCLVCDCGDYLTPDAAREVIALWRDAAGKAERIRANADFHLGQEMARRQLAEKETARLRAVVARLRQMTDYWEQQLPDVIRTPAVVSAIRAALEAADDVSRMADEAPQPETQPLLFWDESAGAVHHDGRIALWVDRAVNLAQYAPAGQLILRVETARALRRVLTTALNDAAVAQQSEAAEGAQR